MEIPTKAKVLFDMGAEANLITERCAKRAGLKIEPLTFKVKGVVGNEIMKSGIVQADLNAWFHKLGENKLSKTFYVMKRLPITNETKFVVNVPEFKGIALADPYFNKGGKIDMLLGVETWSEIFQDPILRSKSGLSAQNTKLGYAVMGSIDAQKSVRINNLVVQAMANPEIVDDLNELLKKFWEIENPDIEIIPSADKRAEEYYISTFSRAENGQYVVGIAFEDDCELGNSSVSALCRFKRLENKLARDPELRNNYNKFMSDYLNMDHMRLATRNEIDSTNNYFIPHHAVTEKFRVVFDGSAITTNGKSINDVQLVGPNLQEKLVLITMRFRMHRFVFSADIKKMYRQIKIHPDDMKKQLIYWRADPTKEEIQVYALKTVTYGLKISPFLALRTMLQIAIDYADEYPLASRATKFARYMDDYMPGADSEMELIELYHQLNEMLLKAGMELGKWKTNSPQLLRMFNEEQNNSVELKKLSESIESVLGLCYQSSADCFLFQINHIKFEMEKLTKRGVSSVVSSIFDPNGYIAPLILLGKCFLSELWKKGIDWDEVIIDDDFIKRWQKFSKSLPMLNELRIPRWLQISKDRRMEFHGFADASKKGYGAVIYVRVLSADEIWCNLLISKSKVAPHKELSTPRLELNAAMMLAKLMKQVRNGLDKNNEPYYLYSDSMVTLHWINSDPSKLKPYVANRVAAIQEDSKTTDWNYVSTKENPADIISRGMNAKDLLSANLWWHGPEFLFERKLILKSIHYNLNAEENQIVREEMKTKFIAKVTIEHLEWLSIGDVPLIERVHSLARLARITALVFKATRKFKTHRHKSLIRNQMIVNEKFIFEKNELVKAIDYWVKFSQLKHFSSELHQLEQFGAVNKKSKLVQLTPYLDGDSILRVRGRLENASLSEDERHPIIIPAHSQFSRLILLEAHSETMHGGIQAMLHYVNARYWLIGARRAAARIVRTCVRCIRHKQITHEQLMSDLPKERLTVARAFHFCGVDYFGPLTVKRYEGRCKSFDRGYAAVFICMTTKMVHIECVSDLTSERFLWALSRLAAIYQMPVKMFSDNAKTFIGAASQLNDIHETWKSSAVGEYLSIKGTTWKFITPRAPSHGGLWEAAVKSAKHHLKRILQERTLTFERYQTLFAKIGLVLNSRPLVTLKSDPTELNYITPAHAVIGQRIIQPLAYDYSEVPINRIQQFKMLEKIQQEFWQSWRKDYINTLQNRYRWNQTNKNMNVGDVVIMKVDNLPPGVWPLARVIEIYPGADGLVRTVKIEANDSTYVRPIKQIVRLPVLEEDLKTVELHR